MSLFLFKALWYRLKDRNTEAIGDNIYRDPINITNIITSNFSRGLEIRNNVFSFDLNNTATELSSTSEIRREFVDSNFDVKFEEQDQIKVWAKYTDDPSDDDDTWANNTQEPDSDNLIGVYYVIEFDAKQSNSQNNISVTCADKTYILFNRLLAKAYVETDGLTVPEVIQKVVRFSCENEKGGAFEGDGDDAGVKYDIDAKLVSDGGNIQDTRRATTQSGGVNTDLDFPVASIGKVWKPVYEWISELSQIEYINTGAEQEGTGGKELVYGQPFIYYVDSDNVFHWKETSSTEDETIVINTSEDAYSYSMTKKVFDTINFVVYRGGEDFKGNGTLGYEVDSTSNVKSLKMRVVAMTDISKRLIQAEVNAGNITEDNTTPGEFTFSGNRYTASFPVTAKWNNTAYANATEYNDGLRKEILRLCNARAKSIISKLVNARYAGNIELKGRTTGAGSLIRITNYATGQNKELLRVQSVRHNLTKEGWFTTLELEEDAKAIEGSLS